MVELVYHVSIFSERKPLSDVKLPDWGFVADLLKVCEKNNFGVLVFNTKTGDCEEARGDLPEGWASNGAW